ncbi:MAG: FMN-binding protein [Bacillota bacterium]
MRKFLAFLAVAAMSVAILGGCTPTTTEPDPDPQPTSNLKDGTYVGTSEADARGGYGVVTVTIANGEISEVTFDEMAKGAPKTSENYTYEEALQAIADLPGMLLETKDVEAIDNITGATGTVDKFKAAANSALAKADKDYQAVLRDGTYTLKSGLDSHNYYSQLTVTIAGNQLTEVDYNEYTAEGKTKAEAEYRYAEALAAIEQLNSQMNDTLDLAQVDDVTGATSTSNTFKSMVKMALDLAAAHDGVYTYETEADSHGYKNVATLALNNGRIVGFEYAEVNAEGVSKLDSGYSWEPALQFLAREHLQQVVENQYGVDFVTGATGSFDNVAAALQALVEMAK